MRWPRRCSSDNQLDEALKHYQELAEADPENAGALVHIGEIQRRQGKYEDALATIRKARKMDPEQPGSRLQRGAAAGRAGPLRRVRAGYREDGGPDLACQRRLHRPRRRTIAASSWSGWERSISEQNKTAEAIATYQKLIDMGGEQAVRGYQFQVDA